MYLNTSDAFNKAIMESSRTFKAKIVVDNKEICDNIKNIEYIGGSTSEDALTIGSTVAARVDVEMTPPSFFIENKEIEVLIGLQIENNIEYVPMGLFTVEHPEKTKDKIKFTAHDRMVSKGEKNYFSNLSFPNSSINVLNEICGKMEISFDTTGLEPISIEKKPSGYTCREMIGYIAGLYGRFANINRNGNLELNWYEQTFDVDFKRAAEPESSEYDFVVHKIECVVEKETVLSVGNELSGIQMSNPFMTQGAINSIFDDLKNFSYRPCFLKLLLGDPRIDPWDMLSVTFDGESYLVPCMELTHNFDGGVLTEIKASGESEKEAEYNYKSPTTQAIDRIYTELLLVKKIVADKITVEYLEANFAKIDDLKAINAEISEIKSNQITVDYLKAKYAEIDLTNIKEACITTAMIGKAVITSEQIADSSVTDAKIVNLTANKIMAGTLSVERLIIRGSTNSIVYELNNITGALQSQNVETLNGEILTERTITADKIVAKSITAAEIASRTITANEILAGTITANEIAANAITTIKLDAGAVTAAKIAAGTITATQIAANAITADKIASKAITADKINVTDLYAIGAKIGGMVIASNKIYGEINSGGTVWGSGIAPYRQNQYSLWVGETNQAKGTATTNAPFRVNENGTAWIDKLYAGNSLDLYESNASWKGGGWNIFRNDCTWNIKQNHHQYGDLKLVLHPWDGETQLVFNWCSQNHGTVYLYGGYNSTTYVGMYHKERNGGAGGAIWRYQTDGNFHIIAKTIAAAIECTTLTQTSTIRAKKDYKVLKPQSALEAIKKTQIYSYTLKGYEELGEQLGVIIEKECPEEIITPERDAINLYSFISLVANAVRELAAQVDAQSSSVALLEKALQKIIKEGQNVRNN